MRLDIVLPNEGEFGIQAMETGPYYEAIGWEGIWLSDHLLGIEEDHIHTDSWLDILIAMAHLAAKTRTIRIGSGVVVLPYRDPVLTARMVASLDQLSGGRIDFGVGVGWLRREYQAVGVGHAFDERGAYSNEMLDCILACWKGGEVSFKGKWFDVPPVTFEPRPVQLDGRVPLWIGTNAVKGRPIERVIKYADYWHPSQGDTAGNVITPEMFHEAGERIDELAGRRIARTIRIAGTGDPKETVDLLHRFAEAGCVQAAVSFFDYFNLPPTFAEFDRMAIAFWEAAESLRKA
jgi:probable F420-dependent oxidoreductase